MKCFCETVTAGGGERETPGEGGHEKMPFRKWESDPTRVVQDLRRGGECWVPVRPPVIPHSPGTGQSSCLVG